MKNALEIRPEQGGVPNQSAIRKTREALARLLMRRASGQFYETVVVVWLTLSVASVVLAAANWARLSRQLNAASQAVAVRLEADSIFQLLLDAQSSQRGYVITEDPRFLVSLRASATNLPARFEHLASLARHDPALLQRVMDLRGRAETSLNQQQRVVLAMQEQGRSAATALVADGNGNEILASIRQDVAALGATPSALVFDQGAGARAQLTRASLTSLAAGILGLGAGLFAFVLSRLTVKHQKRERELIEAKFEADRRSQEKSAFLANMSHEIRTPMNAILGFGELLENELRDEKQRDYLQSIRRSASSLLQLINDTLDMSKIEAGVMELRPEPTDPREITRFIQTLFSEPAARKGLRLSWQLAEDLPRSLLLDRVRLRQILVNLVGNALKFTDQGSVETRIRWQKQDSGNLLTLLMEVEDTGVGIPPDRLEAVFKPFVQAGAHRDKEHQGAGLGLAIVKRLTEMMGGSVRVSNGTVGGTIFRLRFPDVAVSARVPAVDAERPEFRTNFNDLRAATVLGVDDNETNCQLLQGMLAGSHHRLLLAESGQKALEMARHTHPDVILLDVRMPKMDGRQVLQAVREIPALVLTPVIAVTASSLIEEENELRAQFNGYIRKPFSRQDLFNELAQFLPRISNVAQAEKRAELPESSAAPVSGEVLAEVQQLIDTEWPSVRDSVAINESKAFASKVDGLGQRWQCQPLIAYARTLRRHAESYAVVDLEHTLLQFSAVAGELRRHARP
jgi:signal transduction histidine kinase/FixJ family two-component response regulator